MDEWVANVSDNAGRTYALTGNRTLAELLVDNALELRRHLGRDYRIALSLHSRAILYLQFGEPHRARQFSQQGLRIAERIGAQRGIGLTCLTLGQSLRQLGSLWNTGMYAPEECLAFLDDSIDYLRPRC